MSTQHTPLEHDRTRAFYSPHASDDGRVWVFDDRCRRCWYDKAKADYAPLLEAAKALRHPPFSPGICAWCGAKHSLPHKDTCPTIQADAAVAAAEGKIEPK